MSRHILLGRSSAGGVDIHLDVDKLLTTRLLIGANSGGGKSYTVRRICEQAHGLMPVHIFDWEGEFVSLREKFDFVLVGKDGEVPADPRTAKLLMHKLLELRASVIYDLSELSLPERHQYVKLLAEAAIDSPKHLWRETAFVFDEAHELCPENGKGSSVAKQAVLGFPTKGRKRHFLTIFSTQRMHKLAMDARAEFLNRMLGQTFEPDDLDVAAKTLGIDRAERKEFNRQMRTMAAGMFYAFGRAISTETVLLKVGPTQTSNEVTTDASGGYKTPPAPAKIKKLLPQLADLPQAAAKQLATEADLKAEVARLTSELAKRPVQQVQTKEVEVSKLKPEHVQKLDRLLATLSGLDVAISKQLEQQAQYIAWRKEIEVALHVVVNALKPTPTTPVQQTAHVKARPQVSQPVAPRSESPAGEFKLKELQSRIINSLAWYESVGVAQPSLDQLAVAAQVAIPSGHFNNMAGPLSTQGLIQRDAGRIWLTEAGRTLAVVPDSIGTLAEYHEMLRRRVQLCKRAGSKTVEMLNVMISHAGEAVTNETMGQEANIIVPSGHFNNMIGPLSTLGLITRSNGMIQPTDILFPKGLQ